MASSVNQRPRQLEDLKSVITQAGRGVPFAVKFDHRLTGLFSSLPEIQQKASGCVLIARGVNRSASASCIRGHQKHPKIRVDPPGVDCWQNRNWIKC